LWKYNFTEAHCLIFDGRGSPKESSAVEYVASAAPVRTPMTLLHGRRGSGVEGGRRGRTPP